MSVVAETRVGAQAAYYNALTRRRTCTLQGKTSPHRFRRDNATHATERAVDIPIAMAVV